MSNLALVTLGPDRANFWQEKILHDFVRKDCFTWQRVQKKKKLCRWTSYLAFPSFKSVNVTLSVWFLCMKEYRCLGLRPFIKAVNFSKLCNSVFRCFNYRHCLCCKIWLARFFLKSWLMFLMIVISLNNRKIQKAPSVSEVISSSRTCTLF